MPTETRIGWIGSLMVHGLVLVFLLLLTIPPASHQPAFLEVRWGASLTAAPPSSSPEPASVPAAAAPAPAPRRSAKAPERLQPVILPERRLPDPSSDVLPVTRADKIGPAGSDQKMPERNDGGVVGERERSVGAGERGKAELPGTASGTGKGPGPTSGSVAGDVSGGAPYSIEWLEGGARKLVAGGIPDYPPGVNVEAQIKLRTVVLPDGTVESVQPLQKANRILEEVALQKVRQWKFEPLRSYQPRSKQSCIITFQFKLR